MRIGIENRNKFNSILIEQLQEHFNDYRNSFNNHKLTIKIEKYYPLLIVIFFHIFVLKLTFKVVPKEQQNKMSVASVLPIIRGEMSRLHVPSAHDKVYKDECLYSFDSPFSDTGLYLNLATYHGVGHSYLHKDVELGGKLYLLLKFQQLPKKKDETEKKVPTKLAIGTEDGFLSTSQFDIHKDYYLVVVNGSVNSLVTIPLPTNELPEFVSNVIAGVISHEGMKHNLQVSAWDADNEKIVSKYAENLVQLPATKKIPQDPKLWKCEESGATNNLWLNLSTGYIGGGRKNWDGSGGSGSAITHYENTGCKYPLAVKLGTITPKGADVWSYAKDEDCLVIDPYLADHLSYWGIDIMKMEKTDKTLGEMEVSLNMSYDWSKIMEGSEKLEPRSGPGYVGLLNIGASCYLNSVMQSVLALPEVKRVLFSLLLPILISFNVLFRFKKGTFGTMNRLFRLVELIQQVIFCCS